MRGAIGRTGGRVVLAESFESGVFKESLKRLVDMSLGAEGEATSEDRAAAPGLGYCVTLEVFCPPGVKVRGALGPCSSEGRRGRCVSDARLGMGGTCSWVSGSWEERRRYHVSRATQIPAAPLLPPLSWLHLRMGTGREGWVASAAQLLRLR